MKKLLLLALFLSGCSNLTPADKAEIKTAAIGAATAAATNALNQYDNTGKVDPKQVAVAAAKGAVSATSTAPTP